MPYKLYEARQVLNIDLFECLSDLQNDNKDIEVALQRTRHDAKQISDKESDDIHRILRDHEDEIYEFAENLKKDDERLIKPEFKICCRMPRKRNW